MTNLRDVTFKTCNHFVVCQECLQETDDFGRPRISDCPICRVPIEIKKENCHEFVSKQVTE